MFATGAQAQVECTGNGPYTVPFDWALKPSGLAGGTSFRLLFVTSTVRNARATGIATYNTFVQTRAKAGHSAITDSCGNRFKVLGSTSTVDARDNTETTGTGEAIYWLNGAKVADDYADFYDGSWDSRAVRNERGETSSSSQSIFTGSNGNGTKHTSNYLGPQILVQAGRVGSGNPISGDVASSQTSRRFYALSPIFTVGAEPSTLSLSLGSTSGNEGDSSSSDVTVTISLSPTRSEATAFNFCVKDTGTATFRSASGGKAADFNVVNFFGGSNLAMNAQNCHSYTINANAGSSQVKLRIIGDTTPEGNETAVLELRDPPTGVAVSSTAGTATYTINNDDGSRPTVTITGGSPVTEGTGAQFTVNASTAPSSALTVQLDVSDDDTSDFVASGNEGRKTVTIAANQTSATYTVATEADTTDEPNGEVTVEVAEGDGYAVGSTSSAMVTVNDDDAAVSATVSIAAPADAAEGNTGTTDKSFTVTLSQAISSQVNFRICFNSGTATRGANAGDDYQPVAGGTVQSIACANGFLTAGQTSNTAHSIRIAGDTTAESDETVIATLTLQNPPAGVTVGAGTATYTILDDDTVSTDPGLVISGGPVVTEGSSGTYTVRLATQPSDNVTVTIKPRFYRGATVNGYDNKGKPRARSITFANQTDFDDNPGKYKLWSDPQTVTITAAHDDNLFDYWADFVHTVTSNDSNYNGRKVTKAINVVDDDNAIVFFSERGYRVTEGGDMEVTVKQSGLRRTPTAVQVRITPKSARGGSSGTANADFDPGGTNGVRTVTIPANRQSASFTISTHADTDTQEQEETFLMEILSAGLPAGTIPGRFRLKGKELGPSVTGTIVPPAAEDPRVVFDVPALHWDEADGCGQLNADADGVSGNHGPSYRVKLNTRPRDTVRITVTDPHDRWSGSGPRGRAFVDNTAGWRGKLLTFTPSNWNTWRTVKVKVACANHSFHPVAIDHRISRPTSYGPVGKTWTVRLYVKDTKPPMKLVDADGNDWPRPGTGISVEEGAHKDFKVILSDELLPNGSSKRVTVDVAAWKRGQAATAARRDGTARSCGVFDDCIRFTATSREQWVRLRGNSQGSSTLAVRVAGLDWGGAGYWHMEWPVRVVAPGSGSEDSIVQVPTATVSNVQVAAVDDANAGVTWDAVPHATSYEVSWEAVSSDALSRLDGIVPGVTGTSASIWHDATEPMTLTVTVTPEYVDGNGEVQQLASLAGTATLAVGPDGGQGSDTQSVDARAACVSDTLLAEVGTQAGSANAAHAARWTRVEDALTGGADPIALVEVKGIRDRRAQRGWSTAQWDPVIEAMECLETAASQPEQAEEEQTPSATPELSLSAGSAVDEGGNASFTVTADPAPQSDLTVEYTVGESGAVLASPGAGSRTATLAAGSASVTLDIATDNDAADEADGSVSVTLDAGTGYTVAAGQGSAAVTVRDNDEPVVSIAAGSGVTEGAPASFTLTASPAPHAPLDVTVTVGQDGDFAASGATGTRTVTVPAGSDGGSVTLDVATEDDSVDETDGSIKATVDAGAGYTVAAAPDDTAKVAVADNDAAATGPTISIADATFEEGRYWAKFTVTLSAPQKRHVYFRYTTRDSTPVSAVAGHDYLGYSWKVQHRFPPGQTEVGLYIRLLDDSHDEDPETFEVVLSNPSAGVTIADGVAVGTIVNDDPMPAAWLARFGRTAAEQALDGIAGRMAAPRTAGVEGAVAGQALSFGGTGSDGSGGAANDPGSLSGAGTAPGSLAGNGLPAQSGIARAPGSGPEPAPGLFRGQAFGAGSGGLGNGGIGHDAFGFGTDGPQSRSHTMTGMEALLGSSFTATGEKDGMGGSLALWGRAAQSSFDGREGTFSLDGEATTAMLGADYARGNWLVGLALMQTGGEGGYADSGTGPQTCPDDMAEEAKALCGGAVREGDGTVEASLTAAVPYAALQASERLKLWGAAGHGTGEVTLKPEPGGTLKSDIAWTMAAAGLRGDVIAPPAEGSGPALAVTSDALWARTSSDKTHELAASDSDVTRLRIGLEGSYRIAVPGSGPGQAKGGHVTPKLEVGARHDGGDAETGSGLELGGGIAWVDPTLGLSLDLSGRTLIAHGNDDLKDRGFAASLAWDPDPATKRGPSLTLTQDWGGQAAGGLDALFRADPLEDRTGSGEATARWQAEAAWGFPVFGDRFTGSPHVGLGLATGARDYSLGWRLMPAANANAPELSFGVKATRRESDGTVPEHTVGFEVQARW